MTPKNLRVRPSSCKGNCEQGRACDCMPIAFVPAPAAPEEEIDLGWLDLPPLVRLLVVVLLLAVMTAPVRLSRALP